VRTAETIGMAQRGGSVLGYLKIFSPDDPEAPLAPLVGPGQADLLLAFEPAEAARNRQLLKPGGCLICSSQPIIPVQSQLSKAADQVYDMDRILSWLQAEAAAPSGFTLRIVDTQSLCTQMGTNRVLNVLLVGVALGTGRLPVQTASLQQALKQLVPERFAALNDQALALGQQIGQAPEGENHEG